jgi:hypothetical protein
MQERKITVNGEVSFYQNKFNGDPFFRWFPNARRTTNRAKPYVEITLQNITQFMDINLNYQGRKVNFQNYSYWKHPTKSLFLNIINSLIISFKLRHNAVYVSCCLKGIQNNEYKQ